MLRLPIVLLLASLGAARGWCQDLGIEEARMDLQAEQGPIDEGWLSPQRGWFGRMTWLKPNRRDSSYTISFPMVDFAPTSSTFQFHCERAGNIELELKGPYRPGPDGQLQAIEVEWSALQVSGATLVPAEMPVRTWHDRPQAITLRAEAGATVRITVSARWARTPADVPKPHPPHDSAFRLASQFQRGVNLGNFLEVPPGQDWGDNRCRAADYQAIAREGFDHVRLPVGWHHHCGPGPDFAISEVFLREVEQQLDWAEQNQLAVILNLHHFDSFTAQPRAHTEQLKRIWQQLARRLAQRPLSLAFEILNEPKDQATTEVMNSIYAEVLAAIRVHDAERAVFVGPGRFNSCDELPNLQLPPDDRLIVTVHLYEPHWFTHQGASWGGDARFLRGVQFPGPPIQPLLSPEFAPEHVRAWIRKYNQLPSELNPSGQAEIEARLELARQWGEANARPIHLGEFGAYTVADSRSRRNYYQAVRRAASDRGIGWAIWDWKASFAYWDRRAGKPFEGLHDALFQ